jgi:hypothetical protein
LAPAIMLWRFKSPFGTPTPTMGVHLWVWRFIPSNSLHSQEHVVWLLGLPLGPQPCNPLPWSRAKVRVATSSIFFPFVIHILVNCQRWDTGSSLSWYLGNWIHNALTINKAMIGGINIVDVTIGVVVVVF